MAQPTLELPELPQDWLYVPPDDTSATMPDDVTLFGGGLLGGLPVPAPWSLANSSLNTFVPPDVMKTIDFDGTGMPDMPPWLNDTSHTLGDPHPDRMVLGGPHSLGLDGVSPSLVTDSHSVDVNTLPYTVSEGGMMSAALPTYSQINNPNASAPSDKDLGFDPYGLNDWPTFILHPLDALKANELGKQARSLTQTLYPDDPNNRHNDAADAFRHAYWNYTMTKAFGPAEARSFGDSREILVPNPAGERYMDLYNNQVGRDLAAGEQGVPIDITKDAVDKGYTRNSPFK